MERNIQLNWHLLVEEAKYRRIRQGLSQAEFAETAGVAKGTLSRFESVEKGVQLQSALQILSLLGLTDSRWIIFDTEKCFYDFDREAVTFKGKNEQEQIKCAISEEALEDHFGLGGRTKAVTIYKKHIDEIHHIARRKYFSEQFEPDGSILIRSRDV